MSKMLDVIMAGVISGIVALTTTKLGIGGTVIGAVIGAMLYQVMSHFIKEPLENVNTRNNVHTRKVHTRKSVNTKNIGNREESVNTNRIETRIVYVFPLIIIVVVELIYLFSSVYWKPDQIFNYLEQVTDGTLFRTIGLGLLIMGIYPIIQSENIKRSYGYIILSVGIIKLLNGFVDTHSPFVKLYANLFADFGLVISLAVIAALSYVILSIVQESIVISREKDSNTH
ncbi:MULTISPECIES: hypothetical protein [Methanobacterium]|jgi:hypothetical protein|uniref:Uncharacterized protein n=1 Tax=Methanobacterium veterum TaxID=408577 RepID=A0A9E5A432_9EURY|nr:MULTISPECIES: hypothetical protein [Methanobacterium]MCZ3366459.1 hypothetical protein [Methanobacterium veterum]MCZ3371967.1 hypothetical protein [Methanobacterium veterum]